MSFKKIEEKSGKIINDKYKFKKTIGVGGFGNVFLVEEIDTNKEFAIKMSLKENCKITKNEIRILKRLSQIKKENKNTEEKSYIIDIIDNFEMKTKTKRGEESLIYIVLDYMKNRNLLYYFKGIKKTISERYAKYIFLKILKGVQEIHKAGFCHLDLKLENILLDDKYNPIICDFGYATEYSSKLTCYQGTLEFAALELIKNIPFDGIKADIFSLGAIIFNILTGKNVFYKQQLYFYKYNKKYKEYKDKYYQYMIDDDPEGYWKIINVEDLGLSDEFKKLFLKMISNNPEKRPSINQILNDPWMLEVSDKNLTEEEKTTLENNVIDEFKERKNIINNPKDNSTNEINKTIDKINAKNENSRNKSGTKEGHKNYFSQDFILPDINEDDLDMKNSFKINGPTKQELPKILMNELVDSLYGLKSKYNDIEIFITPSKKAFKIDIQFEDDEDVDMPEDLVKAGFNDYIEYKNAFHCQNLRIRIKLFKANDGYLIKVYRKEGSLEEFNEYLGDIMTLIKKLFE